MTQPQVDYDEVWRETVGELNEAGIAPRERAYLRIARLVGLLDSTALLAVPYQHTKESLETGLREQVVSALSRRLDRDVRLAITVDEDLRRSVEDEGSSLHQDETGPVTTPDTPPADPPRSRPPVTVVSEGEDPGLNPKYT